MEIKLLFLILVLLFPINSNAFTIYSFVPFRYHIDKSGKKIDGYSQAQQALYRVGTKQIKVLYENQFLTNKSQQDAFLPHIEDGTITFIGATTENPSFELNSALLSRARVYLLKSHSGRFWHFAGAERGHCGDHAVAAGAHHGYRAYKNTILPSSESLAVQGRSTRSGWAGNCRCSRSSTDRRPQ